MSPASAEIRVERTRTILVLPAPLGPSSEKIVLFDGDVRRVEHPVLAKRVAGSAGDDRCRGRAIAHRS